MKLFEVKDVVRDQVGRDKLSETMFDWCLQRGLREIEKRGNFYWMEASKLFELDNDRETQIYSIGDDLNISDYKDAQEPGILVSDRTATAPEWNEVVGPEQEVQVKGNFTETDSGQPAFWSLREENDDPSIVLWPPALDRDYRAQLFYYKWTTLPTDVNSTAHEVLRRWPEALIYMATEQGVLLTTKDAEQSQFWQLQFINPANPSMVTEYQKIKLYQEQRKQRKGTSTSPTSGASTLDNKLAIHQQRWF